ncbi:MAG TPA: hypothetical protein VG146_21855 [Verrucomicrobiae bacterium]|nr:hypothetical protein [Verrucomicrobiae bacterium]
MAPSSTSIAFAQRVEELMRFDSLADFFVCSVLMTSLPCGMLPVVKSGSGTWLN